MRRRNNIWRNIDWPIVIIYLALILMGWVNIYAAVYNDEYSSMFDFSQRYGKQLVWIIAALVIAFTVFIIDIRFYSYFAYILYGILVFVLIYVLIFGVEINGAKAWIQIGNMSIQPAEFAKFTTALALARYLSTYNIELNKVKIYFRVLLIIFLPSVLIFLQNDTGSALVYFAFFLVLYRNGLSESVLLLGFFLLVLFFLALLLNKLVIFLLVCSVAFVVFYFITKQLKNTILGVLIFIASIALLFGINEIFDLKFSNYYLLAASLVLSFLIYFYLAIAKKIKRVFLVSIFLISSILITFSVDYFFNNILEPHQQERINNLLGIEFDPLGAGYNVNQSKIAIGSGGFSGKGFLRGTQTKFDFVPEQTTDFIFCTIGEEWGFVGTSLIVILFVVFLIRLIILAERQRTKFSRIYGYGVVSILFTHFTVNIGMTIGLFPVIGIPLPFFSYGGSSLWAFTILLFIFLRLDASRTEHLI
ncbi:MAG: rod shape-determining protein RodA [Bacteroidota bacterium]|nr:rod shape-determining protein RodA [Bacteroidota bacterium]